MTKSEEIKLLMEQAKVLSTLQDHPAWQIIESNLKAQLENEKRAILAIDLSYEKTQRHRWRIEIIQWVLKSTELASAEQFAKWERDLAFQQKQETMRADAGLPRDGSIPPNPYEQDPR